MMQADNKLGWKGLNQSFCALLVLLFHCLLLLVTSTIAANATIDNTAVAVGQYNGTTVTSTPSSQSIPVIPANPQLAVSKTGSLNDDDGTVGLSAGDTISYTITVTNPGNVSLTTITVSDPLITLSFQGGDTDNDFRLDPTETWTYTGSYTLTPLDLSTRGGGDDDIDNTVTADSSETPPVTDSHEVPINPLANMAVTKSGTLNDDDGTAGLSAGDTIDYEITVMNNAIVNLTGVTVSDTLVQGTSNTTLTPVYTSGDNNSDGLVNAGEMWLYTMSYTLTQANIDSGLDLVNTVNVTTTEVGTRSATATNPLTGFVDSYTMTKTANLADGDGDALGDVGEVITYTFTFTNTGTRSLVNLAVSDPLSGLSAISCANDLDSNGSIDSLAPSQSLACSATYTVQTSDLLAGSVNNTATSSAQTSGTGAAVTEDDTANDNSTSTTTDSNFELDIEKTVVSAVEVLPSVVDVTYRIKVTNTSAVTHTNITLQDDVVAAVSAPGSLIQAPTFSQFTGFSGTGTTNGAYDGGGNIELLSGDVQLAPAGVGIVDIVARFDRGAQPLNTLNRAFVNSDQLPGPLASDDPFTTPGDPNDSNATAFVQSDLDGDGALDAFESATADRDGDGVPDAQDYDPTGYFYCQADGRILAGGQISVQNLGTGGIQIGAGTSNDIVIVQDGSNGFYQFYVTQPGSYRLIPSLPPTGIASTTLLSSGILDVTSLLPSNPGVLGSGEVGATGVLANFTPAANPFYLDFDIEAGDPSVFNNNIPLSQCGTPSLSISKTIASAPTVQPDGTSNVTYRITVENTGNTQTNNLSVSDNLAAVFGAGNYTITSNTLDSSPVGFAATANAGFDGSGSNELLTAGGILNPSESIAILLELNVNVGQGSYLNTAVTSGQHPTTLVAIGPEQSSVSVPIVTPTVGAGLVVTKSTSVQSAFLGGTVPYTITVQNQGTLNATNVNFVDQMPQGFTYVPGSALVDGIAVEPSQTGYDLVWAGRNLAAGASSTIELQLRLGAGINGTKFTNVAFVRDPSDGSLLSNKGKATIRLEIESAFQCSHVIGRVFNDLNGNGYHDKGEPGLAGVRIANVNGLLITTDQFGRYHVACDKIPDAQIGSNYILKLDTRTLPTGFSVTSENPRVVRLTQGKAVKLNFAASGLRVVQLEVNDRSFKHNSLHLVDAEVENLAKLLAVLEAERSLLEINYFDSKISLSNQRRRIKYIRKLVSQAWRSKARPYDLEISIVGASQPKMIGQN